MNAPVTALATETAQIEAALDVLLTAAIRAEHDSSLLPERGPMSAGVLVGELIDKLQTWTKAQRAAADLLARPVWELTRQGVRTLGQRLHEIGGQGLMNEVLYRVSARDPAHESRRIDIMDKRWDGIGDWVA